MKLILFDIDGTLLRSDGAGRAALTATLHARYGTAGPIDSYRLDGKTDPRIITDLLTAAGLELSRIRADLPHIYELMAIKAQEIYGTHHFTICPGVPALLTELRARPDVVLGLLTGNAAQTAPLKLTAAGLDPAHFPVGAFGSDHDDRNQLPAMAMQRATAVTGYPFSGSDTIIIGDTPADILCARAGGATAVAVATGWHAPATLAQYAPDHLFVNLADTTTILTALLGPTNYGH